MKVKLGDICEIQAGGTPDRKREEYWHAGTIPWVKIRDFTGKYLSSTEEKISETGLKNSSAKLFTKGTILYTIFATLGEVCILDIDASTNQAICGLKIVADNIDIDYLYYFLCSIKETVLRLGRGVAQNNINLGILRNFEIEVCDLEEQRKIASNLDKVNDLIEKRKQQLEKLDLLVKSKFIEMFGDCKTNSKDWETKLGYELFAFASGKFLDERNRKDKGVPVYGGNGIAWYTDVPLINFPTIIIGRVGAYCGNIRLVLDPVWITDNAIYIKDFKGNDFNLQFLCYLMQYMNFKQYADFSGQPKITQKPLEKNIFLIPPLELQNEFAAFVERTDCVKLSIKHSLNKLEVLKKALMQKYFG